MVEGTHAPQIKEVYTVVKMVKRLKPIKVWHSEGVDGQLALEGLSPALSSSQYSEMVPQGDVLGKKLC